MRRSTTRASANRHWRGPRCVAAVAMRAPEVVLVAISGYLTLLTGAAWMAKRAGTTRAPVPTRPSHRFLVLIPAHDEERLIGSTLESLAALDYPAAMVSVHVVADNCADRTVAVARAHGVEVHERVAPEDGGKGPALHWLLSRLRDRDEPHDAVVFVDADTTVSPNFLKVMDAALSGDADVVQSYYAVRDAEDSPVAAFRAAALAVRHYLRPLGRTKLGGSAGLYGNGMVFAADVLADRAFSNHLTEDIELQLELLLEGRRVAFAPHAVVEAEMPVTVAGSTTQHERWERGRVEMARRYLPSLLRRAVTARGSDRVAYADAALDLALPPFSVIVAATAAWSGAVAVVTAVRPGASRRSCAVAAGLVLAQTGYVLSGLRMVSAPPAVYRSLLAAPRLVVWKVRLWLRMLSGPREVAWVRTARNAEGPEPAPQGAGVARTARRRRRQEREMRLLDSRLAFICSLMCSEPAPQGAGVARAARRRRRQERELRLLDSRLGFTYSLMFSEPGPPPDVYAV